jgi:hypothetical protein
MIEQVRRCVQIETVTYKHHVIQGRDSNSNTPPEARHPQNKRTIKRIRILIIITDITIDSSELFGNILTNREDMRAIFDCSMCLVTFTKRENKGIVGWKEVFTLSHVFRAIPRGMHGVRMDSAWTSSDSQVTNLARIPTE